MKLLYIDVNASFLNPTRSLIPLALLRATNARFFGPGYVASNVLHRGLKAFVEAEGPFDVAVTNSHILFAPSGDATNLPRLYQRSYDLAFEPLDLLALPAIAEQFKHLPLPRVGMLLESDYYNWRSDKIDALENRTDYLIALGPEFYRHRDQLPELPREAFYKNVTDEWADYANRNARKIASALHFVADTEFSVAPLDARHSAWATLGIAYDARRRAREALVQAGIEVVDESLLRHSLSMAKRLRLIRKESRRLQRFLNVDFQLRFESCRYAYTCGSGLDMPIRKFFEIPAAGTVLVCKPFAGFEAAGFRDGENAIVCLP